MRTKQYWADLGERAVKTFAQSLIAVLAVGVPIWEMDWVEGLGIAAGATVLSVLTSIASAGARNPESASLVAPKRQTAPTGAAYAAARRDSDEYVGQHRAEE